MKKRETIAPSMKKRKNAKPRWTMAKIMENADLLKLTAIEKIAGVPPRTLNTIKRGRRKQNDEEEAKIIKVLEERIG